MIERERLEKLIDEWARIYTTNRDKVVWCALDNKMYCDDEILYLEDKDDGEILYLKDIFETPEEAEWVAKIHTERTEFFEPPIYEEWLKREIFEFYSKDHKNYAISVYLEFDFFESPAKDYIEITNLNDFDHHKLFCAEKTKDNYIKACEFARNLFLGKENEDESRN